MYDILRQIHNTICETEFEGEFISLKATRDKKGDLVVETETCEPLAPFSVRHSKPDSIRRRFTVQNNVVTVQVYDGEWIPEKEFFGN